jgi:aryl-alcohol dehydrogenase-like predicted oxidoreductase
MNFRPFGNSGMQVSEIGFGGWAIGGNAVVGNTPIGWGPADDATSVKAIRACLDAGVNFFDTADFYGLGHSEELMGKEFGKNKDVIIATKVGHRAINDSIQLDYSKHYIIEACHKSLRRLKRDTIDYYQLHSARLAQLEEKDCIEAMEQLKKEGKIRHWGLSLNTFKPEPEAGYLLKNKFGEGFQLVFNLINQIAMPVMERAKENGFGIIARMPLQFGLLTGKFSSKTTFRKDDHRNFRLTPSVIDKVEKTLQQVWELCEKYETGKTTLALSFILAFDSVSTVIPGIRTPAQAVENTSPVVQIDKADVVWLTSLYQTHWKEILAEMEKLG